LSHNTFGSHNSRKELSTPLTPREPTALTTEFRDGLFAVDSTPDEPSEGERWSSWDGAQHGPEPRPAWVITDLGAVDEDLGVLKSGKEADVHVVRRWVPRGSMVDTDNRAVYMAAKRFRDSDHRMFHRDAGYLEGRRVRRSREMRAMARRTDFGKKLISGQWAQAELNALGELWGLGLPAPTRCRSLAPSCSLSSSGTTATPRHGCHRRARSRPCSSTSSSSFEPP
jgi:RIO kinase 1